MNQQLRRVQEVRKMISMDEFKKIIILRNQGLTQKQIASEMAVSEKTLRMYLKTGHALVSVLTFV